MGQIRTFDTKRIESYLSKVNKDELNKIKEKIARNILKYPST
ncbi:type II toxin-antitoxin system PemK/MazF family toxin [Campylobacter helveticus]